jgi:hypothetical protein
LIIAGGRGMDKKSRAGPVSEKDMLFPPDLQKLPDIIKNIKYGSITMLIRNGQVIQIGKNEKMR